jgi:hypothetical protein
MNRDHHIRVKFEGGGFTAEERSRVLMGFEKYVRTITGKPAVVLQDRMGDDSKLRPFMTPEERAKL